MKYALVLVGILIATLFFANPPKILEQQESPTLDPARETEITTGIATTSVPTQTYEWYTVVKVVDGDTLTISTNGKNVTLRLIGLDTPETVDPRKPVQCFGKEASNKATQLLSGKAVRIEADLSQGELDKYGRTLAYVFLADGTNFAEYMIAEGYGHEYTYNLPYKYQSRFKEAERVAREQKRGLWSEDACANQSARQTIAAPTTPVNSGEYECSRNTYNCSSFRTQMEAQRVFDACGGSGNDIHKLDSDGDGRVCESLPE